MVGKQLKFIPNDVLGKGKNQQYLATCGHITNKLQNSDS